MPTPTVTSAVSPCWSEVVPVTVLEIGAFGVEEAAAVDVLAAAAEAGVLA